jgi:tRNA-dihydrouridine synthase B
MIGRAAVGNPWLFRDIQQYFSSGKTLPSPSLRERVDVCTRHLTESIRWKGEMSGLLETRRHYPHYFKGLPDFKPFRMRLMTTTSVAEVMEIFDEIRAKYAEAASL